MYKQATTKSHDTAESSQTMSIPTMVVNDGDGALGFFINMVKPVIDSVIENRQLHTAELQVVTKILWHLIC